MLPVVLATPVASAMPSAGAPAASASVCGLLKPIRPPVTSAPAVFTCTTRASEAASKEALEELDRAWKRASEAASKEAQRKAVEVKKKKRQDDALGSLEELFLQADETNRLLQLYFSQIADKLHGEKYKAELIPAPVKGETRAIQKVQRSYGGDWRRLCDLCRTTLVFDDVRALARCIDLVSEDLRLQLLLVPDARRKKEGEGSEAERLMGVQRMRDSFDADKLTAGYRDVQFSVQLVDDEAKRRNVQNHICEVQLHLRAIHKCKSGPGHKHYVMARNMRGV